MRVVVISEAAQEKNNHTGGLVRDPQFEEALEALDEFKQSLLYLLKQREAAVLQLKKLNEDIQKSHDNNNKVTSRDAKLSVCAATIEGIGSFLSRFKVVSSQLVRIGTLTSVARAIATLRSHINHKSNRNEIKEAALTALQTDSKLLDHMMKLHQNLRDKFTRVANMFPSIRRDTVHANNVNMDIVMKDFQPVSFWTADEFKMAILLLVNWYSATAGLAVLLCSNLATTKTKQSDTQGIHVLSTLWRLVDTSTASLACPDSHNILKHASQLESQTRDLFKLFEDVLLWEAPQTFAVDERRNCTQGSFTCTSCNETTCRAAIFMFIFAKLNPFVDEAITTTDIKAFLCCDMYSIKFKNVRACFLHMFLAGWLMFPISNVMVKTRCRTWLNVSEQSGCTWWVREACPSALKTSTLRDHWSHFACRTWMLATNGAQKALTRGGMGQHLFRLALHAHRTSLYLRQGVTLFSFKQSPWL